MDSFFANNDVFANIGLQNDSVFFYDVTDSTNTRAREYFIEKSPSRPALFVAKTQTAGKGTRGRSFESGLGGLYFSVLFPAGKADCSHLTAMAAGAVYLSISSMLGRRKSKSLFIKWVNDLYIGEKKISGILSEKIDSPIGQAYIVGIGINLYGSPFSEVVRRIAASVEELLGVRIDSNELLLKIVSHLLLVGEKSERKKLLSSYRRNSLKKGTPITVKDSPGNAREARVIGLSEDFSLRVRYSDGETASLISGDVSIKI